LRNCNKQRWRASKGEAFKVFFKFHWFSSCTFALLYVYYLSLHIRKGLQNHFKLESCMIKFWLVVRFSDRLECSIHKKLPWCCLALLLDESCRLTPINNSDNKSAWRSPWVTLLASSTAYGTSRGKVGSLQGSGRPRDFRWAWGLSAWRARCWILTFCRNPAARVLQGDPLRTHSDGGGA
jgi:hypothetical protein